MTSTPRNVCQDASAILAEALASGAPKLMRKATQLHDQLQDLARDLEDRKEAKARTRRIAELESELRRLQGGPSRRRANARPATEDAARTWARRQGIAVPAAGRVPVSILQAYRAATPGRVA